MRTWAVWIGVAVGVWAVAIGVLFLAGRRLAARELATLLPNLVRMCRTLLRDARVPRSSKLLVGFAVVWFASPIDLVPEFIPVLGPLDDAVLAALVLRHLVKRAGHDVVAEAWPGDPATLARILRLARIPSPEPQPQPQPASNPAPEPAGPGSRPSTHGTDPTRRSRSSSGPDPRPR